MKISRVGVAVRKGYVQFVGRAGEGVSTFYHPRIFFTHSGAKNMVILKLAAPLSALTRLPSIFIVPYLRLKLHGFPQRKCRNINILTSRSN